MFCYIIFHLVNYLSNSSSYLSNYLCKYEYTIYSKHLLWIEKSRKEKHSPADGARSPCSPVCARINPVTCPDLQLGWQANVVTSINNIILVQEYILCIEYIICIEYILCIEEKNPRTQCIDQNTGNTMHRLQIIEYIEWKSMHIIQCVEYYA